MTKQKHQLAWAHLFYFIHSHIFILTPSALLELTGLYFSSPDTIIFHYDNNITYYVSLRSEFFLKNTSMSPFLLCDAMFLIMVSGGRGLSLLSANQKQRK